MDQYTYALFINKKSYSENQCDNLFIIPPFGPFIQLFGRDSMYHALTKIAFDTIPTEITHIGGFEPTHDEAHIFFIKRDPVDQASRFADFISKHAILRSLCAESPSALEVG